MSAGPARRAVVRWAWRLFRREWRQQLAVLALLTAAVAAAVAGATLTVNAASHNHGFGRAHAMARIEGLAPDVAAERIAEARQAFGAVDVISHRGVPVPGSVTRLDVRAQRPTGTFSGPLLALRSGRLPTAAGEVALTKGAAELLGAHVGDRVTVGAETRTVVGRVENPSELDDDFALVPRADLGRADSFQLLFDPPSEPGRTGVPDLRIRILGDDGPVAVLVLVAVTLAMALVGLIAAAGFVVVANRRQRQLGMLAAVGAPERQLRLVMVANGALVGTVAAVAGTALGITAWLAAAPSVEHVANHRIGRLDLPWQLVAACGLLAIAMGMAAAWWPGRALSRLPVMAALSGRPSAPRPVHRSVAVAVALLASGMVAIAVSLPTGERARPWLLIAGLAAVIVGAVFAAPAAIRAVAVPARRLPLAPRLAVRDLARHQSRAAAALAAMTLGLAISVAIVGLAKASEPRGDEGNVSDRQLIIWASDRHTAPDPNLSASQRAALDAHAATVAAALGHPAVLTLDVAMSTAAAADPSIREAITETRQLNPHSFRYVSVPYVATPALLRELHVDPATVSDTVDLLTTHDQPTRLGPDFSQRTRTDFATNVRHVDAPSYSTAPSSLVTEAALRRHGWLRVRTDWLVESPRPLTIEQRAAARAAAASAGLAIETRDSQDALSTIRAIATIAGALLALGIVVMTIGLLRAESSRDLQTLTATGASGRTRRSITASTAAVLSLLGTILGTTGAYAALVAGYHGDLGALLPLPVADLLLLVIGLPVVAAAAGWFLAGPEPQRFAHQALE